MKYHCNRCQRDFTTLSERDKDRKFVFAFMVLEKMSCPHCGASNRHLKPRTRRKGKTTMSRGYAGWDSGDRPEPNIVLHHDCRSRTYGNGEVNCKGCRSVFNCLTGNVDDGDYNAPMEQSREEQIAEAKVLAAKVQQREQQEYVTKLRTYLGNIGFGYQFQNELWYAQLGGTRWKLSSYDVTDILHGVWDTSPKLVTISRTLEKRELSNVLPLCTNLLKWEMRLKQTA